MSKPHKKHSGKRKRILDRRITVRFSEEDKMALTEVKKNTGLSYAQILRDSVHAYYRDYFTER